MNRRISAVIGQTSTILAALMLWGCGQQDRTTNIIDTPTSNQATVPAPEDRGLSFAVTREALEQDGIADWKSISMISTQEQWLPTGLQVEADRPVTIFGFGALILDSLRLEPRNLAWVRVGEDGELIKLASNQITFEPDRSGQLYLTVPPLGMYWESPAGNFPEDMSGSQSYPIDMDFIAVQWPDDPSPILSRLMQSDADAFGLALQKLKNPKTLPDDFSYLWFLGQSDVFDGFDEGERSGVRGYANNNWGIIKKELDLPLTEDAEIGFDWLYTTLPSDGPETEEQYHDYLSIAVEFDNGQDITWLWSRFLDVEQGFRCPLYWWDERETHIVIQSGIEGLGEWYTHRRNITSDYMAHVGGDLPNRIVGVWFIATSLSHTPAEASFANVTLTGIGQEVEIVGPAH
jgi:hypothetical protein